MSHLRTSLQSTITIEQLITMYYFEFGKEYVYGGEKHDFWEFVYVDKGELEVSAEGRWFHLRQGMIIFHKPNEFHSFHANRVKAPNLIVITFDCHSPCMRYFENQILTLETKESELLASIIEEGTRAFTFPFKYPLKDYRRNDPLIGSEQLIKLYLETFLIMLLRRIAEPSAEELTSTVRHNNEDQLIGRIISYLEDRIDSKVTLTDISETLYVSISKLKKIFKKHTGITIMEYFKKMKIDKAKVLIREEPSNFTEIAALLGFSSVHHFSKTFKRETGMSPSEYAKSIKGRIQPARSPLASFTSRPSRSTSACRARSATLLTIRGTNAETP